MKKIPLTQGKVTLVDDEDYEALSAFNWCAVKRKRRFYAVREIRKVDGSRTTVSMHQVLIPGVKQVDHRDGDGLNNRRYNLRPASGSQNLQGFQRKRAGTSSSYRGVSWHTASNKWQVYIKTSGKNKNLGRFTSETDAARAYDAAARKYFGEFASPNFL